MNKPIVKNNDNNANNNPVTNVNNNNTNNTNTTNNANETQQKINPPNPNLNLNAQYPPKYIPVQQVIYPPPLPQNQILVPITYQTPGQAVQPVIIQTAQTQPQVIIIKENDRNHYDDPEHFCYCRAPRESACGCLEPNEYYCCALIVGNYFLLSLQYILMCMCIAHLCRGIW